jgi:L-alanine-DL-glutamate epimerase-like enolase superfamily enzyme
VAVTVILSRETPRGVTASPPAAAAVMLGGITEFMKVAALAQCYDLPIAPHGAQEVHVHLVAAIANGLIVEYYRDTVDPMWRNRFKETLVLNSRGNLEPPDRPGLGVEPNDEALAPYRHVADA